MAPAFWLCGSVGEGSEKGQWPLPTFLCLGESCSPALTLMPDTSVLPCMPLVPFKLLPCCWSSEGVSLSESVCGLFKRNCLGLQMFLPPTQSLLAFTAKSFEDIPSCHWNPGLGGLVWGWDSSLPRYPSQIFIYHTWVRDQPVPFLCPSYQSGWVWFL